MSATQRLMIGLVALLFATGASAEEMRIQFAEKVAIDATPGHTEFDAYGRRFTLDLQANDRLLMALNRAGKMTFESGRVLRGEVRGVAGSWVRLTRVGVGLEGAIWDGRDLYVVTTKERIADKLTLAVDGEPSQVVVYRLSDTIGGLPENFCGVDVGLPASQVIARTGLDQYKSMIAELQTNAAALAADEQLDLSVIADTAFQNRYGTRAREEMLARINVVDGIFSEQVGVMLVPMELRLVPSGSDPFTALNPENLLNQVANYRSSMPEVQAAGLAHLMTGKNLEGTTIGIAFRDVLCDPREGVSLSSDYLSDFYSALVMAHELGHNFGADHDGVAGSGCSTTPQTFLMAPELNFSSQFSQCSLNRMQQSIARARGVCITAPHFADLTLALPPSPFAIPSQQEFVYPITVRSIGNETVRNASLLVQLPALITFQSAVLTNGSCAAVGNDVSCQLGDIPAGVDRVVELRLISSDIGTYRVVGNVTADNDFIQNNYREGTIGLESAVDLGVTMSANTVQVFEGETVDFTIDVSSTRAQAALGGILSLNAGFGATIQSITAGTHNCAVQPESAAVMRCELAALPSGASTRITVRVRTLNPGLYIADAIVSVPNDGNSTNNNARVQYAARPEREIVTTVSTENLRAVIGSPYDIVYTFTSVGRQAATGVNFTLSATYNAVELITPSSGSCSPPGPGFLYCDFGTMDPGAVRTVTVRVRYVEALTTSISASTYYMNGTQPANNSTYTWIYVNLRIDTQGYFAGISPTREGEPRTASFEVRSIGVDLAQNVVAILDVPAPIRLLAVEPVYNPHGFQCAILTSQRARCTGSYGVVGQEGASTRVQFEFMSDAAIIAPAQLSVTADGDGNAANNNSSATITVNPFVDLGITLTPDPSILVMLVDQLTPVNLTLTTNRNPASNVRIWAFGLSPWYRVESISINGDDCPRGGFDQSEFGQYFCVAGNLPANISLPVVVRYRAMQAGVGQGGIAINAYVDNDANGSNNVVYFDARTRQLTDIAVSVAQASVSVARGTQLRFPLITVTNTGSQADDIVVNVPLPSFTSISLVLSSGLCAGVTTLQCSFDSLPAGGSATIDIRMATASEGTFTSNVTMVAENDSTSGNNAVAVDLAVNAPPPPAGGGGSSSGGGAKKGGGSLEWLALAFFGLLVGVRWAFGELAPKRRRRAH